MECTNPPKYKAGFTLTELLVVSAVIATLFGITLPALRQSRESAWNVICTSNQRQMMQGWSAAMVDHDAVIPRTISVHDPVSAPWDDWSDVLYESMGSSRGSTILGTPRVKGIVCPAIEHRFSGPFYGAHHYGYAINCRMKAGQSYGDNEGVKWDSIRSPWTYPWFTDPFVNEATHTAKRYFGAVSSTGDWGVGFYHFQKLGVAAFADGHAAHIAEDVLAGPLDPSASPGPVPFWLLDTP